MILALTMNPSIDTRYQLDGLRVDDVNRVTAQRTAGGKGLNVARVLGQLGDEVLAMGVLGGHLGSYLEDLMDVDGIKHDFVHIAGESRVCINVLHEGRQTEFLESGPRVSAAELDSFTCAFVERMGEAGCVSVSGSLPVGVPTDYYATLSSLAAKAAVPLLLDCSGAALSAALEAEVKPFLIKPNLSELNAILGCTLAAGELAELSAIVDTDPRLVGIEWVIVSMGPAGSVAFHGKKAYRVSIEPIECVNATGSGDSMVAGMAHAVAGGLGDEEALRIANACGALNALDPTTGHLAMDRWDQVVGGIRVSELRP